MEADNQDRKDRITQLQKDRIMLMEEMQHLVEQQVEASRLLGLNYDEQVLLQEQVDAEVGRLAAEVVRLTRKLTQGKAMLAEQGKDHESLALRDGQQRIATDNADGATVDEGTEQSR